jgi:stage II sporulation protein D
VRRAAGMARAPFLLLLLVAACVTRRVPIDDKPLIIVGTAHVRTDTAKSEPPADIPRDEAPRQRTEGVRDVRVALATAAQGVELSAAGAWRLFDARNSVLVKARAADRWTVERRGRQLRAVANGTRTPWSDGLLTVRAESDNAPPLFAGRRYRGAIRIIASDTGLVIVNVLPVEEYLRGVVPLEIGGPRAGNEQAAVEAQAIAARSYTFVRLAAVDGSASRNVSFDMLSSVTDQVYGGMDAERPFSDRAVAATAGQVVKYNGRVVNAPYSSTCGGETSAPDEVWRSGNEPYLRHISDKIPGSDRSYCDIAPRFAWTKSFSGEELDAALRSYLKNFVAVPSGGPGRAQQVAVESRTPSGRVGRLTITTDRGSYSLRGNDIRYVLRSPGGEILNSTYFSVEPESRRDGGIARLILRGNGYGHGIGMCQWGAIGRARAGQSARTILATYYPGTTIGMVN